MNKTHRINAVTILALIIFNAQSIPLYAQSDCESLISNLDKESQKREKFGALTVIGTANSFSEQMGSHEAQNKARILMAEAVTTYMQTTLKDQLRFADDDQRDRFEIRLLGKSEQGKANISGHTYNASSTFLDLTLYGTRRIMSGQCDPSSGNSMNYYELIGMTPEGIIQTIEEAIKAFAEKDESTAVALLDSWTQSELKVSLQEKQKKYLKKFKY